jgi:hypothetical protein
LYYTPFHRAFARRNRRTTGHRVIMQYLVNHPFLSLDLKINESMDLIFTVETSTAKYLNEDRYEDYDDRRYKMYQDDLVLVEVLENTKR